MNPWPNMPWHISTYKYKSFSRQWCRLLGPLAYISPLPTRRDHSWSYPILQWLGNIFHIYYTNCTSCFKKKEKKKKLHHFVLARENHYIPLNHTTKCIGIVYSLDVHCWQQNYLQDFKLGITLPRCRLLQCGIENFLGIMSFLPWVFLIEWTTLNMDIFS